MARIPRLAIRIWPSRVEALQRAMERLGLESLTATADYLITYALAELEQREAGRSQHRSGNSPQHNKGIHLDTMRPPDGIHLDTTEHNNINDYLSINNYLNEGGDLKGGGKLASSKNGIQMDTIRIPDDDQELEICLGELAKIDGWPVGAGGWEKDEELLRELREEFPKVDPVEVCRRLRIGSLENPIKARGARNRLRTYFTKAEGFNQLRSRGPEKIPEAPDEVSSEGVEL